MADNVLAVPERAVVPEASRKRRRGGNRDVRRSGCACQYQSSEPSAMSIIIPAISSRNSNSLAPKDFVSV